MGINILPPTLAESSATHLVQEGTQLLQQGKAEAALEIWQRAEELYRQNQNQTGIIGTKINQAQALTSLGFYGRSCNTVLQAFGNDLECARLTENSLENVLEKFQTSNTSLNFQGLQILGNGLLAFGKLELSEKVLEASSKWVNSNNTKAQLLISLGNNRLSQAQNIANLDRRSGKDERALRTLVDQSLSNYQEAASISSDKLVQIQGTINNLSLLVKFTKEIGDLDTYVQFQIETLPEIIDFLNQINPTPKSILARIKLAEILINLEEIKDQSAFVEFQTNITKLTPPSELLNQAIEEAKDINNFRLEAYGLGTQAKFILKKGNLEKALKLTNKALLTAQKVSAYDIVYQLQEQIGDIFIEQGNYSEALLADKSAFNTLQVLRRDLVALNRDIQFNFRDSIEPLYRKLLDLLLQPELGSNQPNVANIKVAVEVIESLQLAELDNFFQDACVKAQDINIDEIDQNAAVIYPILFEDRLSVILKLPGTDNFRYASFSESNFKAINRAINGKINQYIKKQTPMDRRTVKRGKRELNKLYQWLIKPFEAYLEIDDEYDTSQIKTLVFVLEGNLRNIPMSVLYDSERERYLVERYAIAVAPSLQLLPPKVLLEGKLQVLIAGTDKKAPSYGEKYSPLFNVKQELESINKIIPKSETLADEKFTAINIQDQINSLPFNIVHIATHGQFSSNLEETAIFAWDKPINVKDFDQLLQSENLQRAAKSVDLLILSACETALGDERAALGLAGVAVRAGVRSVLGSLWRVDDASTAELMKQFYEQLQPKVQGQQSQSLELRKAEALREVQIKFIKGEIQPEYQQPYYWSPFILVGNWL